jgi:acyl carrier protein
MTHTREDILEELKVLIETQLDEGTVAKITMDSHFEDDLKIDSLDIIELVIKIEDQFNVEIDDETATELKTVADVLDFILTASVDDSAN